ncbi:MAG: hypothetical protein JKY01_05945, partial [Pseudomonadales bacterium]|nr:hypothetical protein [Pseudomonadales bacterium]
SVKKKLIENAAAESTSSVPSRSQVVAPKLPSGSVSGVSKPKPHSLPESEASKEDVFWGQLLLKLSLSGAALNLARNCCLSNPQEAAESDSYNLVLDQKHGILLQSAREAAIKQALVDYRGNTVKLKIDVGSLQSRTPQQLDDIWQSKQQAAAEQSIVENSGIQALIEQFDARVEAGSIKPRVTH